MEEIIYMGIKFNKPIYPTKNHTYIGTICSNKVNRAIRTGKLKIEPCEICGSFENIEKHHEDYSNPLKVRWLCSVHHLDIHKIFRQIKHKTNLELFTLSPNVKMICH
jgi:hypothetical protein